MSVKAVLFDLDDTLLWDDRSVSEAFKDTCRLAAEAAGINEAELEAAVRREARALYETFETYSFTQIIGINPFEALWGKFERGDHPMFRKLQQLAPEYRVNAWTRGLAALGVDHPELGKQLAEWFPAQRRSLKYVYDETFAVLDELQDSYKLLLLTNGSPDLQQEKLDGMPDLIPYFDSIVISGNFGEGKPSSKLFNHAMEQIGITPDEGIMVGDKLTTDILGANRVGMTSVWINRHNAIRNDDIIPSYEIKSLSELPELLKHINK
ncbi:HAD family hydrolase [Cohnella silvisoli]|uniref:Phosphoserine phosphatase n=1 Tax=Cohnella silvisoli TaxID=2873699 RepID=A0ABV1KNU1_9BACL|nr:HAD family hydrolase [Cohnella silvisoli]MCD9021005.1 HAD family hydrolase [Cohnella silvisoli]